MWLWRWSIPVSGISAGLLLSVRDQNNLFLSKRSTGCRAANCEYEWQRRRNLEHSRLVSIKKPEQKSPKWRAKLPSSRGILKLSLSWPNCGMIHLPAAFSLDEIRCEIFVIHGPRVFPAAWPTEFLITELVMRLSH